MLLWTGERNTDNAFCGGHSDQRWLTQKTTLIQFQTDPYQFGLDIAHTWT